MTRIKEKEEKNNPEEESKRSLKESKLFKLGTNSKPFTLNDPYVSS